MKCTNCGQDVPDTAFVCGYCGHRLKNVETAPVIVSEQIAPKKKRSFVWLWIILGIIVVFVIFVIVASLQMRVPPDLPMPTSKPSENEVVAIPVQTETMQVETVEPTPYIDSLLLPSSFTQYTGVPILEVVEHFNNLTDNEWYYSDNASIITVENENVFEVPEITGLNGYFCSPEFEPNHAILTKFKMSGSDLLMEFFIHQNNWNTPEYKRFGGSINQNKQMITNIWEGTNNSLSNQVMIGTLQITIDRWYGLFIGGNDYSDFTFLVWDLEDPNKFTVQLLEQSDSWGTGLWHSCFQVFEGNLYLDDYSIVSFEG
ncbi:MAG: hypothetical protein C0410_04450 [Anaerolinea sp.]|nr:hypothetical protein [Anaerolinea sp.]